MAVASTARTQVGLMAGALCSSQVRHHCNLREEGTPGPLQLCKAPPYLGRQRLPVLIPSLMEASLISAGSSIINARLVHKIPTRMAPGQHLDRRQIPAVLSSPVPSSIANAIATSSTSSSYTAVPSWSGTRPGRSMIWREEGKGKERQSSHQCRTSRFVYYGIPRQPYFMTGTTYLKVCSSLEYCERKVHP